MLEHVLTSSEAIGDIDHTYVVTNEKFAGHFEDWRATQPHRACTVVNDGTSSNEDRLGAIGDLHLVIEQQGIDEDLLVIAGDNLFTGNLSGFGARCRETETPVLGVYDVALRRLPNTAWWLWTTTPKFPASRKTGPTPKP